MNINSNIIIWSIIAVIIWIFLWMQYSLSSSPSLMNTSSSSTYTWWTYTDYDPALLSWLSGNIVLFFHADWCPSCRQAEENFLKNWIPEWLTILKVDFDTETDLRKKYSILTQTSFVSITSDWPLIKRWVGGLTIEDIMSKIRESQSPQAVKTWSNEIEKAYFAGGCFRCLEWPFEAHEWVKEVHNWYIGGDERNANYDKVSLWVTKHREAIEIVYDPALVSYDELLTIYRRQIDPTDDWGQFADRWYQYTTAIYYSSPEEEKIAQASKQKLEDSKKFDKPIVVQLLPTTPFYKAEEYHQDYYKKNSENYMRYKKWSGREWYIETTRKQDEQKILSRKDKKPKTIEDLTPSQRAILFEWGTEPAFNNAYRDNHEEGIYVDVIDGTPLFSSTDKFDSGTGRPSFTKPIDLSMVDGHTDTRFGITRTEVKSKISNWSLWHVFDDGPKESGWIRYCINSAALEFVPLAKFDELWYSEYKKLFIK